MTQTAIGKVAAAIYGEIAPTDTSFLWGKQLDAIGNPQLVQFLYHDGTNWLPLKGSEFFKDPVLGQLGTPPVSPSNNDRYLVSASGTTGAFIGHENAIAVWDTNSTSWLFTSVSAGDYLYKSDDEVYVLFNGTIWMTQSKTTEEYFDIAGGTGVKLKSAGGGLEVRDLADASYLPITVQSVTIAGPDGFWLDTSKTTLNYPATGANDFIGVDGITNAIDLSGQDLAETFDFIGFNAVTVGRSSTGDANFLRLQKDANDTFKVDVDGNITIADSSYIGSNTLPQAIRVTASTLDIAANTIFTGGVFRGNTDGTIYFSGTNALTGYTFRGDPDSAFIWNSADDVGIYTGGIEALNINPSQEVNIPNRLLLDTTAGSDGSGFRSINIKAGEAIGQGAAHTSNFLRFGGTYSMELRGESSTRVTTHFANDGSSTTIGTAARLWSLRNYGFSTAFTYPNTDAYEGYEHRSTIDISGQLTGHTTDPTWTGIDFDLTTTGRTSTGDANHIRLRTDGTDVFKVDIEGLVYTGQSTSGNVIDAGLLLNIGTGFASNTAGQIRVFGDFLLGPNTGNPYMDMRVSNNPPQYAFTVDTDSGLGRNSADDIGLYTGGVEAINIDASQNTSLFGNLTLNSKVDPDPTGANGMLYYNSTNNKFRAFENSVWVDMIGAGGGGTIGGSITDNQIAVGATTADDIEGSSNLTFDGSTFAVDNGSGNSFSYSFGTNSMLFTTDANSAIFTIENTGITASPNGRAQLVLKTTNANPTGDLLISFDDVGRTDYWAMGYANIAQEFRINYSGFTTISELDSVGTTYLSINQSGDIKLFDGGDLILGTTTGTKIGTATTQKLGFWNTTPVVQPIHIVDPSGGATVDSEARTAINAILAQMATTGMQAAS